VTKLELETLRTRAAPDIRDLLKKLWGRMPGILAAQVCTLDGFEIASLESNSPSQRRLAAMVSSIHALGAAIVTETQIGEYANLVLEGTQGKALMMSVPGFSGQLLLAAIGSKEPLFGHFHAACRACCEELRVLISNKVAA
jgi:predicted regulator of Ras-like GTPase activity (Roadblock/LC7/MglB family)